MSAYSKINDMVRSGEINEHNLSDVVQYIKTKFEL